MTDPIEPWQFWLLVPIVVAGAAAATAGLIRLLLPLLQRTALAAPNARSSHTLPTPQGGGIAVIAVTIVALAGAMLLLPVAGSEPGRLALVFTAVAWLAAVGAVDDIFALEAMPRLLLQTLAVAAVVAALPAELRILHALPWWIERALILVALVWFVNLVNFMDGIDWMTVAEVVPLTAGLALAGITGALPAAATLVALALGGAMLGFAPFNRPVARLFLGDVGSLPLGLLLGWLLVLLAGHGHLAAALLLPLYYLADATITLLRRLTKGEPILRAHRSHFYQRALDAGLTVYQIVGRVFAVNLVLLALAAATLRSSSLWLHIVALAAGAVVVGALLWSFSRGKR